MSDFYLGDIVFTACHLTGKSFRPHLITNVTADGRIALCPLTHTPQGKYEITELGGGTFIAATDKFSGANGDVRFVKETLSIDLDGDQSADFAVNLPGTKSLKEANLLL